MFQHQCFETSHHDNQFVLFLQWNGRGLFKPLSATMSCKTSRSRWSALAGVGNPLHLLSDGWRHIIKMLTAVWELFRSFLVQSGFSCTCFQWDTSFGCDVEGVLCERVDEMSLHAESCVKSSSDCPFCSNRWPMQKLCNLHRHRTKEPIFFKDSCNGRAFRRTFQRLMNIPKAHPISILT